MTTRSSGTAYRAPLTGRRVFNMLLGFFGLIAAVNGTFIYFALETWPGLGTRDAYRKGLAYNETLKAAERQHALGWRSEIAFLPRKGNEGTLRVLLKNAQNAGLAGLTVSVRLTRPVREGFDRTLALSSRGDGHYQSPIALPLKGRWQATVEARADGQIKYRMTHELMVR